MKLTTNDEILQDELVRLIEFFENELQLKDVDITIQHEAIMCNNIVNNRVFVDNKLLINKENTIVAKNAIFEKRYYKRFAKLALYEALSQYFNKTLAWGSLTGIRPTKLFYELIDENNQNPYKAKQQLVSQFYVPEQKANLCLEIINQQKMIEHNDKLIDLYIHIPFCTSKCYYCSFITAPLANCQHLLEPYLEALITELEATKKMIAEGNYIVKTIYIGGGTPTSLSADQLDRLLSHIGYPVKEFTVECGRPDTITKEKLDVLLKHHVTRISINPQTFSNKTLKSIGRNHTAEQLIEVYQLALNYPFDINMDLIAGLDKESLTTFKRTINKTISLHPDNITVHTLSVKRTSQLQQEGGNKGDQDTVTAMVDYAYNQLTKAGYHPYYLYRQKNMIGNLENIGYCLDNKQCIFNIDSMEEVASVIAVGANAISKRLFGASNRIERCPNVKNLPDYIARVDQMIERKRDLFLNKNK